MYYIMNDAKKINYVKEDLEKMCKGFIYGLVMFVFHELWKQSDEKKMIDSLKSKPREIRNAYESLELENLQYWNSEEGKSKIGMFLLNIKRYINKDLHMVLFDVIFAELLKIPDEYITFTETKTTSGILFKTTRITGTTNLYSDGFIQSILHDRSVAVNIQKHIADIGNKIQYKYYLTCNNCDFENTRTYTITHSEWVSGDPKFYELSFLLPSLKEKYKNWNHRSGGHTGMEDFSITLKNNIENILSSFTKQIVQNYINEKNSAAQSNEGIKNDTYNLKF